MKRRPNYVPWHTEDCQDRYCNQECHACRECGEEYEDCACVCEDCDKQECECPDVLSDAEERAHERRQMGLVN